jgi:hypothetical protein
MPGRSARVVGQCHQDLPLEKTLRPGQASVPQGHAVIAPDLRDEEGRILVALSLPMPSWAASRSTGLGS